MPTTQQNRVSVTSKHVNVVQAARSIMNNSILAQESATAATLQVSWPLTKAKKPFADAELIKKCAVEMAAEVLSHDEKKKKAVVELLKRVPLSANMATRRVEVLAEFFSVYSPI